MVIDPIAILDPIAPARRRMHARRSALRGTGDMQAYAQMLTDYFNELSATREQMLSKAQTALADDLPTAAEFAQDVLDDVAVIDAELHRLDPRQPTDR